MAKNTRGEVIFSGIGGAGVLTVGEFVAEAATKEYEHVVWFPNYSAAVRGGPCECFVIYSNEEIASPVLSKVQTVVVLDPAQFQQVLQHLQSMIQVDQQHCQFCSLPGLFPLEPGLLAQFWVYCMVFGQLKIIHRVS